MYSVCKIKNISGEESNLHTKTFDIDEIYTITNGERLSWAENDDILLAITNENFQIHDESGAISGINEQINHLKETERKVQTKPFSDKHGYNFDGQGQIQTNVAGNGATTNLDYAVGTNTNGYDFQGMKITGQGGFGNTANLKVLDDSSGTYSGTPNAILNQFATNWNVDYPRCENIMPYAARLYPGMVIRAEYTNNQTSSETLYINYYLHKVVE